MILHTLEVSGWRSLLSKTTLGPFSEGINIVHAPNGTGKSSMFEALCRALFDAYQVTGTEIKEVRPWGRELTPRVAVEFTESDERWRVEKAFLNDASARLLREEGGRFVPVADGREADVRIRQILAADAPGRGLSKQEHWGLAQVLWTPQGNLKLDKVSASVAEQLRAAVGVQVAGESGGRLDTLIHEQYSRFFTASGNYRSGKGAPPIVALQEKQQSLQQLISELREQKMDYEEASRAVEDARLRREQEKYEAESIHGKIGQARVAAERYHKLKSELDLKRERASMASQSYEVLTEKIKQIESTRNEIAKLEAQLQRDTSGQSTLKKELETLREKVELCRRQRDQAREKRTQLDRHQQEMDAARLYLEALQQHETLKVRLEQLNKLETQQLEKKQQFGTMPFPKAAEIRKLRTLLSKQEQARAAVKASQVHLTLTPEHKAQIRTAEDETPLALSAGTARTLSGDQELEVEIVGWGRIRASGPKVDAQEHQKVIKETTDAIAQINRLYSSEDPEVLQQWREAAEKEERDIQQLEQQILAVLGKENDDELTRLCTQSKTQIAKFEEQYPQWTKQPPVLSELQAQYDDLKQQIDSAIDKAEDAYDRQQTTFSAAEKQLAELSAQVKTQGSLVQTTRLRLETLTGEETDAQRKEKQKQALMHWHAMREEAKRVDQEFAQVQGDPVQELKTLERLHEAAKKEEDKARDEEKTAEGRLQTLVGKGAYSRLVQVEEELADLEKKIKQEQIRMDAVLLLHDTVQKHRQALVTAVADPVQKQANWIFSRIVGPRLGGLTLSPEFVPDAVLPERAEEPVGLSNLSAGEQEQLFIAVRLALALTLAKDQRQLVVLDDVLNATDQARHGRILNVLDEVSDRLQVIVLTCHKQRYDALRNASHFELKVE